MEYGLLPVLPGLIILLAEKFHDLAILKELKATDLFDLC
jgi:hypothetical protein